jgi:hypothetical protein
MRQENIRKVFEVAMAISASAIGLVFVGGGIFGSREIAERNSGAGPWAYLPLIFSLVGIAVIVSAWRSVGKRSEPKAQQKPRIDRRHVEVESEEEEARQQRTGNRFAQGFLVVFVTMSLLFVYAGGGVNVAKKLHEAVFAGGVLPSTEELIPVGICLLFFAVGLLAFLQIRKSAARAEERMPMGMGANASQKNAAAAEIAALRKDRFGFPVQRQLPGGQWTVHTKPVGTQVTLRPIALAKAGAIALGIFALIWNGAVVGFLINGWNSGVGFGAFLSLFMLPFLLVGGVLIALTVRFALSKGNPVPILNLNSDTVRPGGSLQVRWRFEGSLLRYRGATFFLEAQEVTVRGSGDDEEREAHRFFEEKHGSFAQSHGEIVVHIPRDAVLSFESKSNSIIWSIKVQAEIDGRPDVSELFRFWVKP